MLLAFSACLRSVLAVLANATQLSDQTSNHKRQKESIGAYSRETERPSMGALGA